MMRPCYCLGGEMSPLVVGLCVTLVNGLALLPSEPRPPFCTYLRTHGSWRQANSNLSTAAAGSEECSMVFSVRSDSMGRVIGRGGQTIRGIERESGGATLDSDSGSGSGTSDTSAGTSTQTLTVKGTREQVTAAKRLLISLLAHTTQTIRVSDDKIGAVVGRKGTTISYIQKASGATVRSQNRKGSPGLITLQGSVEQVEEAKRLISEASKSHWTLRVSGLLPWQVKSIKGRQGQTAAAIQARSLASLKIAQDEVIISGLAEHAELGRRLVKAVLQHTVMSVVPVPHSKARLVIGKGGQTIAGIREQTGASVEVTEDGDVEVFGLRPHVDRAVVMVEAALQSEKEMAIEIEPEQTGLLLGKGGTTISRIQSESGARVHLDDKQGDDDPSRRNIVEVDSVRVVLSGRPECIEKANELIEAAFAEELLVKIEVNDQEKWAYVLSRSRSLSQRMGEGVRATLRVHQHCVVVYGVPDAVRVAADAFREEIEALKTCQVELTEAQLRALIGKKGSRIQALEKSSGARLRSEKGSSQLVIQGTQEAVDKAQAAIDEFLESERSEELPLPENMFGAVVGKAGANIKRIEKDSGARVSVNRGSQTASVKGSPEQRSLALEMIKETLRTAPTSESIELTEREAYYLIGPQGCNARIIEAGGATLHLDRHRCLALVRGNREQVDMAVEALEDARSKIQLHRMEFLPSEEPRYVLEAFRGAGRKHLRKFETQHSVKVTVESSENYFNPSYFVIMGGVCEPEDWNHKVVALERELEIAEDEVRGIPRPEEDDDDDDDNDDYEHEEYNETSTELEQEHDDDVDEIDMAEYEQEQREPELEEGELAEEQHEDAGDDFYNEFEGDAEEAAPEHEHEEEQGLVHDPQPEAADDAAQE